MRNLTWQQFDSAVKIIASRYVSGSLTGVYGVPRGGLCLGVALSHELGLPLLQDCKPGCLVVDDVYETGKTLQAIRNQMDARFVVWVTKCSPDWWGAVITMPNDEWLVFPWENVDFAQEDERRYQASRSSTN